MADDQSTGVVPRDEYSVLLRTQQDNPKGKKGGKAGKAGKAGDA